MIEIGFGGGINAGIRVQFTCIRIKDGFRVKDGFRSEERRVTVRVSRSGGKVEVTLDLFLLPPILPQPDCW
jgi:hypothetical protein